MKRIAPDHSGKLPAGLVFHCDACRIVVPAEAPRPAGGDCLAPHLPLLTWFNPRETLKGQHTMAAAAWELIYHRELRRPDADPVALAYLHAFKHEPRRHFDESHARQALTPEQLTEQRLKNPKRDFWAYKD